MAEGVVFMKSKAVLKSALSLIMPFTLILSALITAGAVDDVQLTYEFSGKNADTSGYAQGTITLTSPSANTYYLYWADENQALEGYYEIAELSVEANSSGMFVFDYHTVIPAGATKIIATTDKENIKVSDAKAVYDLPKEKLLSAGSGEMKYTFSSYSDVHIDPEGFYKNYDVKWAQALNYAARKDTDFIVTSGDVVNFGSDYEWAIYEKIIADSDYVNSIYESDGNHDLRSNVTTGLNSFIRGTGTDNTTVNYNSEKPYYYIIEETTGDLFIFMALERDYKTHTVDCFSQAQMEWVTNLIEEHYGTGVNIYIVEHAPIKGFGAGDRMDNPYYQSHLSEEFQSTVQFKNLLQKYPKLIWMSGHTHIDFAMGYNYSNENDTACHMIHNPAVVGSTWAQPEATGLDYNDGYGYNSQGYYVEVYENQVIYYGANLTDEKIYPAYCYIMDGARGINYSKGDVNQNGEVTIEDATHIQKALAKQVELTKQQESLADVNGDGAYSIGDVARIQMYIANIIEVLSEQIEEKVNSAELDRTEITELLSTAKTRLNNNYDFASYNQYQALKKLYSQYKNTATAEKTVADDFNYIIAELDNIVNRIGNNGISPVQDTYYFANEIGWNNVYGYAWTGNNFKVSWPGEKLEKVGTYNGYDVYGMRFDRLGQCQNLIFNNGTGTQTVDIGLLDYSGNCFTCNNGDMYNGVLRVHNMQYNDATVQLEAPVVGSSKYLLGYYNSQSHGWSDMDTYFKPVGDGTFKLEFTAENAESISCNVYNIVDKKYNCVSASTNFEYSAGLNKIFTLATSDNRGKSITINGLSAGLKITFIYNPASNTLDITCG